MQVEHVIVSNEEVSEIEQYGDSLYALPGNGPTGVPRWAIFALSPAVVLLPLLCVLAVVSRILLRAQSIYVKYAWTGFFSTLLTISGLLTSVFAVAFLLLPRMPAVLGTNIPDFDERQVYPRLPFWGDLESAEVSIELKPLVIVVSPVNKTWGGSPAPAALGAGVLLMANKDGYLFATAKHLVSPSGDMQKQALISTASGMRSSAEVIAFAGKADLALLWINRRSGSAIFTQPVGRPIDGEPIFVIGHPEGLNYTLSTGIVSGLRGASLQITAAVSPGNSGGPVYDAHGNLVGVVSAKFDRNRDANADNLGFATTGELLEDKTGWNFAGDGELRLQQYIQALGNS